MIFTLALRSLMVHPVRSAVLACGFGLGVSVMATLLGVGDVILEQARSPALVGGGDLLLTGATGAVTSARFVLSSVLKAPPLQGRVKAASPTRRARLYLVRERRVLPVLARGGVPSLERALGDPETAAVSSWADAPGDSAWSAPDPGDVLRSLDRFHAIPDVAARARSWAEWLYFNGRAGNARFYLTFFVGPRRDAGRRDAGVRLQLDSGGRLASYSEAAVVEEKALLEGAPDLAIGRSRVRLSGLRYELSVDLPREAGRGRASGTLFLEAVPGRSVPPFTIRGASGWLSGYVVPVLSGALDGELVADGERLSLRGGQGYHDHNWGFWKGVSWRWGQVHHEDLSLVYGRVYPPADAADPERVPGVLAVLGKDGPLGYSTQLAVDETDDPRSGRPQRISVRGTGGSMNVRMELEVEDAVATRMGQDFFGAGKDFLQLRGRYHVSGQIGGRKLEFTASGAAETFRER